MATLDPLVIDLATLAGLAGNAANGRLLARIRTPGTRALRVSHGYVIQRLIDGSPTIGELAAALGVTQQGASKAVSELERMGLVARRADGDDKRIRRLVLTPRGRQSVERARAARQALENDVLADVGPDDLAAAKRALVSLLTRVGALDAVRQRRVAPPAS